MTFETFIVPFSAKPFMANALLAGFLVSVACGIVGTLIVLRGLAFIGDALAHGVLPGVAMAMLLGLGLGLIPLLVATSNGFLLGVVAHGAIQQSGPLFLAAGILPHGILELPAVLVSIAIGFRLGYLLSLTLAREKADLAGETRIAVRFLWRYITPTLFLAAIIETFITPIAISVVS